MMRLTQAARVQRLTTQRLNTYHDGSSSIRMFTDNHQPTICQLTKIQQRRQMRKPSSTGLRSSIFHHSNISNIIWRNEGGYESPPFVTFSSLSSSSVLKKPKRQTKTRTRARTIEEQYSRKTPIEHILLRPGMYVGPVERCPPTSCWIPDPIPPPPSIPPSFVSYLSNNEETDILKQGQKPAKSSSSSKLQMIHTKDVSFFPALIKIFDEILVNAFDNRLRPSTNTTNSTTQIDVIIYPGGGADNDKPPFISIQNDGRGIPIQIHKKEKMYLPEMLFGHLLTGSNFDDTHNGDDHTNLHSNEDSNNTTENHGQNRSQGKVTGGRHGYGAKLTNIFSKSFQVDTFDSKRKKRYSQRWEDNMGTMHPPDITQVEEENGGKGADFTRVSFVPDLDKLSRIDADGTDGGGGGDGNVIPPDDYAIMCRRVMDVAGCSGGKVTVTLNGTPVPITSFEEYANLYRGGGEKTSSSKARSSTPLPPPLHFQRINARWEVGIGVSSSSTTKANNSFEHTSFVNGITTSRGGTHVDAIVKQITKKLTDKILRLYPELAETVTQSLVRRHLCVFVNALVENPTFDSQMKECLTSSPGSFGSRYGLTDTFLNGLVRKEEDGGPGIVEQVVRAARGRQQANLLREVGGSKKTRRQLLAIPKLDDAHLAGGGSGGAKNRSGECTLILTEGDSAKALAVAGMEIIGRDRYGVFPLRGKFLNVREAKLSQLMSNHEVKAVCSILGLDFDEDYETLVDREKLRYGHVMLMTDQDADGSHIKGLVINFHHCDA